MMANNEEKTLKWVLAPLILQGITVIAGRCFVGKSFLALNIACWVASTGKRVLYYDFENTISRMAWRIKLLFRDQLPNFLNNIFLVTIEDSFPRLDEGGLEIFKEHNQYFLPNFIIIDPLIAIKPKTKKMQNNQYFRELTNQGISILITHPTHLTCKMYAENIINEIAKNSGFLIYPDNVVILERDLKSEIGFYTLYSKSSEPQSWVLSFKNGKWSLLGRKDEIIIN